jgi:Eco29kI restriction endonuclease
VVYTRICAVPFVERFEINIVEALSVQLLTALNALTPAPLDEPRIVSLEDEQGIYLLYHRGTLVYVGKAGSLPRRLADHRRKIAGRQNIALADMEFKCLFVHANWTALAPEAALIRHFKAAGNGECPWNGNGFGPHDPGRDRETTNKAPDGFDAQFPIREGWVCDWVDAREWNCRELLLSLKGNLPYLLRYQAAERTRYRGGHPDYNDVDLLVPHANMTAAELLGLIARRLPGWQATAFPSHMIVYKEDREYTHGRRL